MERSELIKQCKTCENRKFDKSKGLVCSLEVNPENINDSCNDYSIDLKIAQKIEDEKKEEEINQKDKKAIKSTGILIGAVLLLDIILKVITEGTVIRRHDLFRMLVIILFSFFLSSALYQLPFFRWRFRRMIKSFGYKTSRGIVTVVFFIFLVAIFILRGTFAK